MGGNVENAAHPNTITCTAPTDEGGDDESSSGGSVIRVPMVGSEEEEEEDDDDCSSNGSVIRVGANEGACSLHGSVLRAFVGSDTYEDDGNCSDDSVVKVPAGKTSSDGNAKGQGPTFEETPHRAVEGLGLETGPGYQDNDENGKELEKTGQAPAHMKMNLLAASKYFGSKGGASDGGPGAAREGERGGLAHISQKDDGNPQVRSYAHQFMQSSNGILDFILRLAHTFGREQAPFIDSPLGINLNTSTSPQPLPASFSGQSIVGRVRTTGC